MVHTFFLLDVTLYKYSTFYLSIVLLMDIWGVSSFVLLEILLL